MERLRTQVRIELNMYAKPIQHLKNQKLMSVQVSTLSTHLSLRRDLLLDHVARHVGLQQLGLSATQIHVSRGVDTSRHVAASRVMRRHVGPGSWASLQSELLQVLQPQPW